MKFVQLICNDVSEGNVLKELDVKNFELDFIAALSNLKI